MRKELKYIISDSQLNRLDIILKNILETDVHQSESGYKIRSLYFDTEEDRFLWEGNNGLDIRDKYRIRFYDNRFDVIRFEKKYTMNNLKAKESCLISKGVCQKITVGDDWYNNEEDFLKEIYLLEKKEKLQPKIIVEYDRFAYVSDIGDVRITFDKNIRASQDVNEFLEDPIFIPILPQGKHILEVKYTGVFPGYLSGILDQFNLERVSFSKYGLCRNLIINNGRLLETYEY